MEYDEQFEHGFLFGINVLSSMGHKPGLDAIVAQLMSLASGEMSLMPSPEEAIKNIEADAEKPLPDVLKASVRSMLTHRAESDSKNRAAATFMLQRMGLLPDD